MGIALILLLIVNSFTLSAVFKLRQRNKEIFERLAAIEKVGAIPSDVACEIYNK